MIFATTHGIGPFYPALKMGEQLWVKKDRPCNDEDVALAIAHAHKLEVERAVRIHLGEEKFKFPAVQD